MYGAADAFAACKERWLVVLRPVSVSVVVFLFLSLRFAYYFHSSTTTMLRSLYDRQRMSQIKRYFEETNALGKRQTTKERTSSQGMVLVV